MECSSEDLIMKIVLILGIHGLLRISEITSLDFQDIKKENDHYVVTIQKSKTDIARKGFQFFVQGSDMEIIDKYIDFFKINERTGRFIRKFENLKISGKPIGKNSIGKIPSTIANMLNLKDSSKYTGHCFRRTGAKLMADAGVDKITLKRAGRWKSDTVCEGYIEESASSKLIISKVIGSNSDVLNEKGCSNNSGTSTSNVYNFSGCSSFSIVFNVSK
jgi:integrase